MKEGPHGNFRYRFRLRHDKDDNAGPPPGCGPNRPGSLNDRPSGCRCRVRSVGGAAEVRQRLLDLGLLPNAQVAVVRSAPLNDPIQIRLDDDNISIRRSEAALIEVDDAE